MKESLGLFFNSLTKNIPVDSWKPEDLKMFKSY